MDDLDFKSFLLAIVLLFAVIITYSNHFNNGFYFDDTHAILNNIYIKDIRNIPRFFTDCSTADSLPQNRAYRPFLLATFAVDYRLGHGFNPFYFHLTTFILFILQAVLMYLLYLKIFRLSGEDRRSPLVAFFGVAWYLLHPANAETINYILARSDSLSTLFVVLAFVLFLYSGFARKWRLYLLPVALGIFTKPTAVMFAPLLLAYLILFEEKISLAELFDKRTAPQLVSAVRTALPAIVSCVLLFFFTRVMESGTWTPGGTSRFHYLITQPYVLLHYFTTFFLPISLSADTDWTTLPSIMDIHFFAGLSFVVLLFAIAVVTSRRERLRPVSFGILWFFISLVPTSTVIPLAEVMNDHRLFYPYVGLTMSACWALALLLQRAGKAFSSEKVFNRSTVAVVLLALAAYANGTHQRNEVWKTDETLWRDVTEKSPRNGRGLMNYGLTLMTRGDFSGAERYFVRALEFTPYYSYLHLNLGILKNATKRPGEAEQHFRNAIAYDPGNPECYFYHARFLKEQGQIQEAITGLQKALELAPAHLQARYLLMDIYAGQREFQKLTELAGQTLKIVPSDRKSAFYLTETAPMEAGRTPEDLLELSLRYYEAGQYNKSIEAARESLKLRPDYDRAYNNICAAYNKLQQWDKAIEAGEKAVRLNPNNQLARNNLAWAVSQKHKKP